MPLNPINYWQVYNGRLLTRVRLDALTLVCTSVDDEVIWWIKHLRQCNGRT